MLKKNISRALCSKRTYRVGSSLVLIVVVVVAVTANQPTVSTRPTLKLDSAIGGGNYSNGFLPNLTSSQSREEARVLGHSRVEVGRLAPVVCALGGDGGAGLVPASLHSIRPWAC